MQCDMVASIPDVVALNVIASPLKSIAYLLCVFIEPFSDMDRFFMRLAGVGVDDSSSISSSASWSTK